MKEKTYKVYEFNELSKEAKKYAITKWYEMEDYPFLTEDLRQELENLDTKGIFSEVKLAYSLSCCQGDGLSFSAKIDLEKWLKSKRYSQKRIDRITDDIYNPKSVGNTGRYAYASESDIELEFQIDTDENLEIEVEGIRKEIASYYLDICKKLEKYGYAIMEYRMNEEEFAEMCEANGYEFTEEGKLD